MKKQKILIATANPGKIKEIKEIFNGSNYRLYFLSDFKKKITINENAKSFEGNALIKAIVAGDEYDILTLGDDSGLCVDALGGRPERDAFFLVYNGVNKYFDTHLNGRI